jgi:hypothetical protein
MVNQSIWSRISLRWGGSTCHGLRFAPRYRSLSPHKGGTEAASGAMAGGGLAAAAEELTVVFLFRPLIAVTFVLTLILLSTMPSSPTFCALVN